MIKGNIKLFDHMVGFARRQAVPGEQLVPSAAVGDVEMRPDTKEEPGGRGAVSSAHPNRAARWAP